MTATIDALVVSPIGYYLRYTVDQQAEPVASGTGQMTQAQEEQWARFDLPHGLKRTDGTVLSLSDGTGSTGGSMAPQDGKEVCTRGGTFAQTIPVEEIAAFVVGGVETRCLNWPAEAIETTAKTAGRTYPLPAVFVIP